MERFEKGFYGLVQVIDRLRDPGGCPWDRKQTLDSLKPLIIEEIYEVIQAIEDKDPEALKEELGDVLMHVVFLARIAKEQGWFKIDDVIEGIKDKLIRRHPHVFGDVEMDDADEVIRQWEEIKKSEGKGLFDGVPRSLPALTMAMRVSEKAAHVGFEWPDLDGVLQKLREEFDELNEAVHRSLKEAEAELGDCLFTLVNVARFLKIDPESALKRMIQRFIRRFSRMESLAKAQGKRIEDMGIQSLDALWEEAKKLDD